jgi:hypothetical protein
MADVTAPVLSLPMHPMPLLAHLEELRKRIIFSMIGILAGFFLAGRLPIASSV